MRVVHVFKDFYPPLAAGITRYLRDVAEASVSRGLEVEVHVAGVQHSRRDQMPNGVVVHRHRELGRFLSSPISPGLVREVRTLGADLIHLHMPNPIGELGSLLRPADTPTIVSFHAQLGRQRFLEPIYGHLRGRVLSSARAILVASEALAGSFELAASSDRVHVIPYGVSPLLLGPALERPGGPRLRVLFVGRLVYYKGIDVLLRSMALLPTAELTIVGEGPIRRELEILASSLSITDRVTFAGGIDDDELVRFYGTCDCIVLPSVSRAEAFGLSMVEAMANGLPAVSTKLDTGTDWVNLDGKTGFVVRAGDADELAAALDALSEEDLRRELGSAARLRASELFSFDQHMDGLLAQYEKALA